MNTVFVLAPGEDWIVDRFVKEWYEDNADISVRTPAEADVIWLLADWAWTRFPRTFLERKRVITTIHHIVPEKFGQAQLQEFTARDQVTTVYHVPNQHTYDFIRPLTQRPIHVIPYWANQRIWRPTGAKGDLRKRYGLPVDGYLVGSFQRDTEGSGIERGVYHPKLEKGPDLLADAIIEHHRSASIEVVLGGWRRQYLMKRLGDAGVRYHYFELPTQDVINDLYQTLDLYPVTARYEGGPQSLIECGLLGMPCVSRDVGMARQVLPPSAISDDLTLAEPAIPSVEHLKLPGGYRPYRDLIQSL